MTGAPPGLLEVGRVGKPHGIRGDVHVDLSSDRTERLSVGSRLFARDAWLTVRRAAPQGRRWLVTFDELADRGAAERLTNAVLYAEPLDDPDALWVHELIGAEVREADGTSRGRCVAVVANPAADLLELESGALVPVTFVLGAADGVVTVETPDGLFDAADG